MDSEVHVLRDVARYAHNLENIELGDDHSDDVAA